MKGVSYRSFLVSQLHGGKAVRVRERPGGLDEAQLLNRFSSSQAQSSTPGAGGRALGDGRGQGDVVPPSHCCSLHLVQPSLTPASQLLGSPQPPLASSEAHALVWLLRVLHHKP